MPLDPGQASVPASATIEMTHQYARFLTGAPLQVVLTLRNVLWDLATFVALLGPDDLGPPQYLILRDRQTKQRYHPFPTSWSPRRLGIRDWVLVFGVAFL